MGAAATGFPLTPSSYVAGTLVCAAANTPYNLLTLIQQQLDINCPSQAQNLTLQTDASGVLYVGRGNPGSAPPANGLSIGTGGVLSTGNYGYALAASGGANGTKTYESTFPGTNACPGNLMVLMTVANGTFHVEVA